MRRHVASSTPRPEGSRSCDSSLLSHSTKAEKPKSHRSLVHPKNRIVVVAQPHESTWSEMGASIWIGQSRGHASLPQNEYPCKICSGAQNCAVPPVRCGCLEVSLNEKASIDVWLSLARVQSPKSPTWPSKSGTAVYAFGFRQESWAWCIH